MLRHNALAAYLVTIVTTAIVSITNAAAADELLLANDGRAQASIRVGRNSTAFDRWLAAELQRYVCRLSGANLPIVISDQLPDRKRPLLLVGSPTSNKLVDSAESAGLLGISELRDDGFVLINTTKTVAELGIEEATNRLPAHHVSTVPATELAMKYLQRPTPNTVLLGALTTMTDTLHIESVCAAILHKFPGPIGEMNVEAARAAHAAAHAN